MRGRGKEREKGKPDFLVGECFRIRFGGRQRVDHHSTSGLEAIGVLEREFFIDNLLVRIHVIIEMILVDRPCAMGI